MTVTSPLINQRELNFFHMHAQEVLLLFVVHTKITRSHDLGSGQYSGQLNWKHNRLGDT